MSKPDDLDAYLVSVQPMNAQTRTSSWIRDQSAMAIGFNEQARAVFQRQILISRKNTGRKGLEKWQAW